MKHNYTFRRTLSAMLLLMMSTLSWAQDFYVNGIYYNINEDGKSVGVSGYTYYFVDIVIPSTVTYNNKTYSVTSIGDYAFYECSSLTSISIPESVISIGDRTFYGCSSLASISIPESVTSIGDYAFSYCSSLTSISIPEGMTSIGRDAFYNCSSLTSITVAANNPVYDSREGCNAIIETASNTLIWGFQSTIIPESVTSIRDGAFDGCSSLTSISIPEGVKSIGDWAFGYCSSLTSISISKSVTSIGDYAFGWCSSLTSIICYAEEVPKLGSIVFYYTPTSEATLYVPASAIEDYKTARQWKDFGTILPLEDIPAGISNIEADETNAPYYTLDGKRVDNPTQKGIYIRNGKKILIK